MPKRKTERNRTNRNSNTISQQRARANAAIDGRGGRLAAYTGGARTARQFRRNQYYPMSEQEGMRQAWENRTNVATYTSTRDGRLSVNGRNTSGAVTNAMTPKNDDGSSVINPRTGEARQSGRSELANRRQRDYDNRKAMNNINPRVVERWRQLGWVRDVNGEMVGDGQNVRGIAIHQKADGNYSMGLAAG